MTLLQLQVADSLPPDECVPAAVTEFYSRSRDPSPHPLEDLRSSLRIHSPDDPDLSQRPVSAHQLQQLARRRNEQF
eukprot:12717663-Heterocapsa_arctica.AAC.1